MAIYQFLIAVRSSSNSGNQQSFMLTNADGETTSHIQGMFNRTIRYMTEGIRPVYVFDGKPPQLKSGELLKRKERREKATAALLVAQEENNVEELDKQSKRLVRAGTKENADCQKLLTLMGIPIVLAPCEAEAQASHLAKTGQVYATGTEDMDALTFQTPILIRKLTFANATKATVQSINYSKALDGLNISYQQFVDLCIMLGCDYCDTIRGVGPKTALKLIREHKDIETILQNIDTKKFTIPESWLPPPSTTVVKSTSNDDELTNDEESPNDVLVTSNDNIEKENVDNQNPEETTITFIPAYVQARGLFMNHEVIDQPTDLKWKPCQEPELITFLVDEMGFNIDRVKSSIEKLKIAYKANTKPQARMDSFFKVIPKTTQPTTTKNSNNNKKPIDTKRKGASTNAASSKKMKGKR